MKETVLPESFPTLPRMPFTTLRSKHGTAQTGCNSYFPTSFPLETIKRERGAHHEPESISLPHPISETGTVGQSELSMTVDKHVQWQITAVRSSFYRNYTAHFLLRLMLNRQTENEL